MPFIFFANKDEAEKTVSSIHYQPNLLDEQTKSLGVEVTAIPEPETRIGKEAVLKYQDGALFYEYKNRPLTQEEELTQLKKQQVLMQSAIDDMLMMGGGL